MAVHVEDHARMFIARFLALPRSRVVQSFSVDPGIHSNDGANGLKVIQRGHSQSYRCSGRCLHNFGQYE